ncbi:MAG: radical SAM protein [Desulfomonilaceae bacterium]
MTQGEAFNQWLGMNERLTRLWVYGALVNRGISYRVRNLLGLLPHMRALTITVTRRCNSRCIMCNIWRLRKDSDELALEEITRFLSSPSLSDLVELDLTGGEPLLRPDLPQLIEKVCALKHENLRSLKTIALATNGLLPGRISEKVERILRTINGKFDLAMVCSLDGIGECHDQIRGVPGAYSRALENIQRMGEIASRSRHFRLGIKTTILPHNWEQIPALMHFAAERGLFHVVSPVLFTAERFRNLDRQPQLELLTPYYSYLIAFYSSEELADYYYSHVVLDTLKHGTRRIQCSAGTDHFFVEGDGRIFPCPLVPIALGDIRATQPEGLLSSPKTLNASRMAGRLDQCKWCLEPGCIRFSQCTEGFAFLRFLLSHQGKRRFRKAYFGEGLFKYL